MYCNRPISNIRRFFVLAVDALNPLRKYSPSKLVPGKKAFSPKKRKMCINYAGEDVCTSVAELTCKYQGPVDTDIRHRSNVVGYHFCLKEAKWENETNPSN